MKEKLEKVEKKKIGMVVGFLILIVVILFGGALIYNKFFYKRSYSEIEEIMVSAAKNYFSKNSDVLPKDYNVAGKISVDRLVAAGEMKTIHEYLKDEAITCDGDVIVTNINGQYLYTPSLKCGDSYQTTKFIDHIKSTVPIVESGNGLYNMNDDMVYRGEDVSNYLKFNGKIYRIVKFSKDYTVIIFTDKFEESVVWDNRYNSDKNSSIGINDYSVSRIKEYLEKLYEGDKFISPERKLLVVAHDLNIGKRTDKDTDKTGNLEKAEVISNQFIGLLPLSDYLNASLDANCNNSVSKSCQNYNYLGKFRYRWWTITATSANSHKVYAISNTGQPILVSPSSSAELRPVLYLTKEALYASGNGTKDDPYIIK